MAAGCSDNVEQNACASDEVLHPITRVCVPKNIRTGHDDLDASGDVEADVPKNPFLDMPADVPGELACSDEIDSDQDGLTNGCECKLTTDPARPDTDGDGALDGQEDINKNCKWDLGEEPNPRQADTDSDGALDGAELDAGTDPLNQDSDEDNILDGAELESGCLDPLSKDTDNDGLPDDVEDVNKDGELGTCVNRVYSIACANGESDPCKEDTDGDGTKDSSEAKFLACKPSDTANLVMPASIVNQAGDYRLVLDTNVKHAPVTGIQGHAFNDAVHAYAGFVLNIPTPNGLTDVAAVSNRIYRFSQQAYGSAVQRSTGRRVQTFDGFSASVRGVVELPGGLAADIMRDKILGKIAGIGRVVHNTPGAFSANAAPDPMLFLYEVVIRNAGRTVVVGVLVPESEYRNDNKKAGIRVDDLTGGVAVAKADETTQPECVSYKVSVEPKIDFIWILDTSGSMSDERNQVKRFAKKFAQILQSSNLDWRIGVTSASCYKIQTDPAISADVKALFAAGGSDLCAGPPPGLPIPIRPPRYKNGELCSKNNAFFTTDPAKFEACIGSLKGGVFTAETEHSVTIGTAAIDRALPRADNNPQKIRPGAAVVVISVTDEFDKHFEDRNGWTDAGMADAPPNDPTLAGYDHGKMVRVAQPFVDYYLRPEVGATVFGIYWIPGTSCNTAAEAAAGIEYVVSSTGGTAGSICQSDLSATLQQIADASAGLASGLRLRGVPLAPSLEPKIGEAATGNIVPIDRSRMDGFDYDSVVNRVSFVGPNPPQTADRIIIPYLRWEKLKECVLDSDCPQVQKMRCIEGTCI